MHIQFLIVNEGDDVHIFFHSLSKKKYLLSQFKMILFYLFKI